MTLESPSHESDASLLARTRASVVNLMLLSGLGIAVSGGLLRFRDRWSIVRAPESTRRALLGALVVLAVASYLTRRLAAREAAPARGLGFYRGHVLAAAIAFAAVPLGLVYGWVDRPRLESVGPFWVVSLALGILAFPRANELEPAPIPTPDPDDPRS